jgi:DNA-binding IclR family transcriptional regulator
MFLKLSNKLTRVNKILAAINAGHVHRETIVQMISDLSPSTIDRLIREMKAAKIIQAKGKEYTTKYKSIVLSYNEG